MSGKGNCLVELWIYKMWRITFKHKGVSTNGETPLIKGFTKLRDLKADAVHCNPYLWQSTKTNFVV